MKYPKIENLTKQELIVLEDRIHHALEQHPIQQGLKHRIAAYKTRRAQLSTK